MLLGMYRYHSTIMSAHIHTCRPQTLCTMVNSREGGREGERERERERESTYYSDCSDMLSHSFPQGKSMILA